MERLVGCVVLEACLLDGVECFEDGAGDGVQLVEFLASAGKRCDHESARRDERGLGLRLAVLVPLPQEALGLAVVLDCEREGGGRSQADRCGGELQVGERLRDLACGRVDLRDGGIAVTRKRLVKWDSK